VDNASNETGFTLQRATNTGFTLGLTTFPINANAMAFTDSTVSTKVQYYYRILAFNALGNSAYSSRAGALTPGRLPANPTNLLVAGATRSSITIRWTDNANNEQGFYVERSTAGANGPWTRVATVAANSTTFINSGNTFAPMKSNTSYWYRVRAYNADGTSAYTNVLAAKTLP
jgi:titin